MIKLFVINLFPEPSLYTFSLQLDTTSKVMKRGRVPKGFLSSNTAYMLVYKRLTADNKNPSTGKRGKTRKFNDGETNNTGNAGQLDSLVDFTDIDTKETPRLSPEEKKIINGIVGYHPPTISPEPDTIIKKIEDPPQEPPPASKNVKLDYRLLNGDAHRNMSCGEHDFYENVSNIPSAAINLFC